MRWSSKYMWKKGRYVEGPSDMIDDGIRNTGTGTAKRLVKADGRPT